MKAVQAKPKTRAAKVAKVIFHRGQPRADVIDKDRRLAAKKTLLNQDIEILNRGLREKAEAICNALPSTLRPELQISNPQPMGEKRKFSLPFIEVHLPNIDSSLIPGLSFVEYNAKVIRDDCRWTFSLTKPDNAAAKKSTAAKQTTAATNDTNDEDTAPQENEFSLTVESPSAKMANQGLTTADVIESFNSYLDELLKYGTFPLDKKAEEIFTSAELQPNKFAELLEQHKYSLNKTTTKIYEILDKFANQGFTVRQLAKQYPEYSHKNILQFILNRNGFNQGINCLELSDYVWDNSVFCQVMVDLKDEELKLFEQAVKELKVEHPDLLKDFDFVFVDHNDTKNNLTKYVDSYIANSEPPRRNILVVGNTDTNYEELVNAGISGPSARGASMGFFGLLRIWGKNDSKTLQELRKKSEISTRDFDNEPVRNVMTLNPAVSADDVDYEQFAKASLQELELKNEEGDLQKLKNRLLKLFQTQELGHGVLQKQISPALQKLINLTMPKAEWFKGTTLLSLILWLRKTDVTNIPLAKLFSQTPILSTLVNKLSKDSNSYKIAADELVCAEIKSLKDSIQQTGENLSLENKMHINDLAVRALPLTITAALPHDTNAPIEIDPMDAVVSELTEKLKVLDKVPLLIFIDRFPFVSGLKAFVPTLRTVNDAVQIKSKITEKPDPADRATKLVDLITNEEIAVMVTDALHGEKLNFDDLNYFPKLTQELKYKIATIVLMAWKNPTDNIWMSTKHEFRIKPADMCQAAARALVNLGMIDLEPKTPAPPAELEPAA